MGDADDIQHLRGDEVGERGRVGRLPRRNQGWPARRSPPRRCSASRWTRVARASGISRGTTTSGRRSFSVTAADRCNRSLDSPSAMLATASVDAGTTTIPAGGIGAAGRPGREVRRPARCARRSRLRRARASRRAVRGRRARRDRSRPGCVRRAARLTTRSIGSPAASRPRNTDRAYGVPEAPEIPTTQGVRTPHPARRRRSVLWRRVPECGDRQLLTAFGRGVRAGASGSSAKHQPTARRQRRNTRPRPSPDLPDHRNVRSRSRRWGRRWGRAEERDGPKRHDPASHGGRRGQLQRGVADRQEATLPAPTSSIAIAPEQVGRRRSQQDDARRRRWRPRSAPWCR